MKPQAPKIIAIFVSYYPSYLKSCLPPLRKLISHSKASSQILFVNNNDKPINDLPGDIKSMIYKANKESERDEAYNNKNKYNEVLTEMSEIIEDNDIGSITPSLIWEINFDDRYELYQEEALDRYYD